jgi:hypothetical protein
LKGSVLPGTPKGEMIVVGGDMKAYFAKGADSNATGDKAIVM